MSDKRRVTDNFPVQTAVMFQDPAWSHDAASQSGWPLNSETVLDYFALSQFFDRTSVNAELQMQRHVDKLSPEDVAQRLQSLPGIVYQLDNSRVEELQPNPPFDPKAHSLYVIRKLHRSQAGEETTLRYYYVMDGMVYEAPTILAVVQARMKKLGWYLSEAFAAARKVVERDDAADEEGGEQPKRRRVS